MNVLVFAVVEKALVFLPEEEEGADMGLRPESAAP